MTRAAAGVEIVAVQGDVSGVRFADLQDRTVALADFAGRVVVIAGGGRDAAQDARRWGWALGRALVDVADVAVLGVAFVGRLPRLIPRRLVRAVLAKEAAPELLVAWDDEAGRALGLRGTDTPHVFLVDRTRALRWRVTGPYAEAGLRQVLGLVDDLRQG
jgi:hypothetical protein